MKVNLCLVASMLGFLSAMATFNSYGIESQSPLYFSVSCVATDSKSHPALSTFFFPARDFEVRTNDQGHFEISAIASTFWSTQVSNPKCSNRAYHERLVRADAGMQAYPSMPQRRDTALGGLAGGGGGGGRRDTSYGDLRAYYEDGNLVFSESSGSSYEPDHYAPVVDDRLVRVKGVVTREWNAYRVYPSEERKELTCAKESKIVPYETVEKAHAFIADKMVSFQQDNVLRARVAASVGTVTHPECIILAESSGEVETTRKVESSR